MTYKTCKPWGFGLENPFAITRAERENGPVAESIKHLEILHIDLIDLTTQCYASWRVPKGVVDRIEHSLVHGDGRSGRGFHA